MFKGVKVRLINLRTLFKSMVVVASCYEAVLPVILGQSGWNNGAPPPNSQQQNNCNLDTSGCSNRTLIPNTHRDWFWNGSSRWTSNLSNQFYQENIQMSSQNNTRSLLMTTKGQGATWQRIFKQIQVYVYIWACVLEKNPE